MADDEEETDEYEVEDLEEVEDDGSFPIEDDDERSMIIDSVDEMNMIEEEPNDVDDLSIATFLGHGNESVYCVAVSMDKTSGKPFILTGGGDDKAYLWTYIQDSARGNTQLIREYLGHTDSVTTVGFNFDNSLVLTGSYDGTVKIWTKFDGIMKMSLEGPEDVEWAEWHSKGNAVVAGSRDGTIWMWLAHSGECVHVFAGHDGEVSTGCFTRDGKSICSGGEDGTVRVWAPKTGVCKHVFSGERDAFEGTVTCVQSSEDGELILAGGIDGKARLFQVSGKRVIQTFVHSTTAPSVPTDDGGDQPPVESSLSVECVGFYHGDPALNWIATGGLDGFLRVWDANTGQCRCSCKHEGSVVALKWHVRQPVVVTASLDHNVRAWDARSGAVVALFTGHLDSILAIEFISPTEGQAFDDMIVTASDDHTSKIFILNLSS